jgi:phosphatidylglycerophosphate synthase
VPTTIVARDRSWFGILTSLGGASDLVDGRLARRSGETRLGRDLDRTADIAFFGAAAVAAARAGWMSSAAAVALVLRYGAAFGFSCLHYFRRGMPPAVASDRWASPLVVLGLLAAAAGLRHTAAAAVTAGAVLPLAWHGWRIGVDPTGTRLDEM